MIYFGDYVGQLLAELTAARLHSDVEAVRVAELYAAHDLLKHFPVPRMRVGQIDMDIPVSIVRVEASDGGGKDTKPVTALDLLKRFQPLLREQLERQDVKFDADELGEVTRQLHRAAQAMSRPNEVAVDSNRIADRFSRVVRDAIQKSLPHQSKAKLIANQLRLDARVDFLNARPTRPRIVVGVTTAELKESPQESLVRISLRVSEEGVEWTNVADEADPDLRLLPE